MFNETVRDNIPEVLLVINVVVDREYPSNINNFVSYKLFIITLSEMMYGTVLNVL